MRWLYIIVLFLVSLYFVIGGISFILIQEDIEYAMILPPDDNMKEGPYRNLAFKDATVEYNKLVEFYPVKEHFGNTIFYLIILVSFGIMGTIIQSLLATLRKGKSVSDYNIYAMTILGSVIGLLTIVISEFIPEFKNESGNDKFYYTIALLGGIYTEDFYNWLFRKFKGIIGVGEGSDSGDDNK